MSDSRIEYLREKLEDEHVLRDPFSQFEKWFAEASESGIIEPNAAALATADSEGKPSVRIVLIKEISHRGFVFFTNYQSRKGNELEINPYAAINFFWDKLQRQVRIEGKTEKLPEELSEKYYHSRPVGSRLSAWASKQSQVVNGRKELEKAFEETQKKYQDKEIPKPPHWGGYLLRPEVIEFWQGRENRMHDRIIFRLNDNKWETSRLYP